MDQHDELVRAAMNHSSGGSGHFHPKARLAHGHTRMRQKRRTLKQAHVKEMEEKQKQRRPSLSERLHYHSAALSFAHSSDNGSGGEADQRLCSLLDELDDKAVSKIHRNNNQILEMINTYVTVRAMTILDLFIMGDEDRNGQLTKEEFRSLILAINLSMDATLTDSDVRALTELLFQDRDTLNSAVFDRMLRRHGMDPPTVEKKGVHASELKVGDVVELTHKVTTMPAHEREQRLCTRCTRQQKGKEKVQLKGPPGAGATELQAGMLGHIVRMDVDGEGGQQFLVTSLDFFLFNLL